MNTQTLSTDLLRRLALLQHLGEAFFMINVSVLDQDYKAFEGNEDELRTQYDDEMNELNDSTENSTFEEWCINNCTEIEELDIDDCYNVDYYVLTDSEADEKAKEYITESLWAFTPNFLSERTGLDTEVFKAIQNNGKCESNNDSIYNIVQKLDDIDEFVSAAIGADGRGHFMSSYDGCENEETIEGETFYIYRIN